MRWQGGRQSENVEDRRRRGPSGGVAAGGGAMLLIAVVMFFLGGDPRQLQQLLQQVEVQRPAGGGVERPETAEDIRSREFAATILAFTEEVWDEQFRQIGRAHV